MNFQFLIFFRSIKNILILINILLVFFLILLNNLDVLPVQGIGDFIFFTISVFAFALYRPGWAFLFFVGTIALENINLAPASVGINIRPYQFIGGLTLLAVLIRVIVKRLNFSLPKWNWMDGMIFVFAVSGFLSALGSEASMLALKQAIIMTSFAALYFLTRIFIQSIEDLKKIIPFFLSSSALAIIYGIWQNIRFMKGLESFEVMPGRANATFTEPDWLGIYLVVVLAILYSLIFYFVIARERSDRGNPVPINSRLLRFARNDINLYLLFAFCFILLILTVSRSAWLGAAAVSISYLVFCIWYFGWKNKNRTVFFQQLLFLAVAIISSFAIVYVFNLTSFQLFNRAQSTGTGLQKITVSCKEVWELNSQTWELSSLEKIGCRHINLEDISMEKANGNIIMEVYRQDPNVSIRKEIYQKSWVEIKKNPLLGIGWGNIGNILGKDERGTGLNSSNIFLEIWLGAGILGILSFVAALIYIFIESIVKIFNSNEENKIIGLFAFLGIVAIIIPNLFNAGIMAGFLWLYFGIAISLLNAQTIANRN